jgi:hypothetical protein
VAEALISLTGRRFDTDSEEVPFIFKYFPAPIAQSAQKPLKFISAQASSVRVEVRQNPCGDEPGMNLKCHKIAYPSIRSREEVRALLTTITSDKKSEVS